MTLPAYQSAKNTVGQSGFFGYKICVEFLYDKSNASPALWQYYRKARYNLDLTVTIDQLGNPAVIAPVTFFGGSPIGNLEDPSDLASASVQMSIVLPNAAREVNSICENYDLSQMPVRVLWVHPDHLSDGAVREAVYEILQVAPVRNSAVLTVRPYSFSTTTTMIPREVITSKRWPGVAGIRAQALV